MHTLKKPLRNVAREKPKLTTTPGNDNGHKTTQTPSPQDKPRHPHQSLTGASAPPASPPHLSPHHRLEEPTEPAGLSAEEHPSPDTSTPSQDCRPTTHHLTNPSHPAAGPKLPTEELQRLEPYLRTWLADSHTYTSRVGGVLLMSNYLRDLFRPEHLQWVARIPSQDYYSHMLQGWYLATALVTQPDAIWPVLRDPEAAGVPLSVEARLKAIQKSIESRRISAGDKTELRALRAAIRGRHA